MGKAKTNIIQTDFLAGEISPRMEMQDNLEGRKHGVELMENFFPHLQGSAETSRGLEHVTETFGFYGRMFGFPVAFLTGFMVVVANSELQVMDSNGVVKLGDIVVNGYFDKGGVDWVVDSSLGSSAIFLQGGVILSSGLRGTEPVSISQLMTAVPVATEHTLVVTVAFGGGPLLIEVGSADGLSDILSETAYGLGGKTFSGLVSGTGEMWVNITLEAGELDKTISGVQLYDPTEGDVSFSAPWITQSDTESIQALMIPDERAMVFASSVHAPYKLSYVAGVWSFALLTITDEPAEWDTLNYPPAVGFFGGRMWLGGVASDSSLFWGSKAGEYGVFTLGELAADAIEARLDRQGAISWIAGGPGLLIGTSNAEHVVSSEAGVITPGDISSQVQSTNGSYPTQSLEVGNEVMYISPDGRKLRSIGFEWLKDSWRSRDLTYASEHITDKGNAITHLNYAANPNSAIIGTTRLGTVVSATYEPYSQTTGFSRRSTQGEIVSVGVVSFGGADEVWMLIDNGNAALLIGRERHPDNVKLDSYTTFTSAAPISGGAVPYLATRTCQVLVDGAVHPDVIPGDGGVFETEYSGNEIQIGLKISSIIKTLPVADRAAHIGTTRSMRKRLTEIWVKVLDSWRPKINGRRTPNRRAPTPMGEVEPARTESVEVANDGWDLDAQITIEQDLPLKTEVSGWFGRLLQEEI